MRRLLVFFIVLITLTTCKMDDLKKPKEIYTLGIWTVNPGKQKELIEAWTQFANWSRKNVAGPGKAYLLQDEKDSLRFISFGPWDNENSISKWRETDEFKGFVEKAMSLCEDFKPNTLTVASVSD